MNKASFYAAVYWIIENERWEILFWKRQNTSFANWLYGFPAWHIEFEETINEALIREMKEELNINIKNENIELVHILHKIRLGDRTYFDIFLKIKKYTWTICNNEPEKCSELKYFNINDIKKEEFMWYEIDTLEKIKLWIPFSELKYNM